MNQSRRAALGAVLLILGIGLGAVAHLAGSTEQVSYYSHAGGTGPRPYSHVTAGKSYELSVHGGLPALSAKGLAAASILCSYSTPSNTTERSLTMTAQTTETKAVNTFATFTAPLTGPIAVQCTGWGPVYVDDADDAPGDLAGWYLIGCVIALTVGAGLALSALRSAGRRPAEAAA